MPMVNIKHMNEYNREKRAGFFHSRIRRKGKVIQSEGLRLILFFAFFSILTFCCYTVCGASGAGQPDPSDPQLVVFSLGTDGIFNAAEDNYIQFDDDVIVLKESDGFFVSLTDGVQNVAGTEFSLYRGSGGALPPTLVSGSTVCYVPSDTTGLPEILMLTVRNVSGNTFTAYAGPPASENDGGGITRWLMKWLYKHMKDVRLDAYGEINDIRKEFNYFDICKLKAVFHVGLHFQIWKEKSNGQLHFSYEAEIGIPSLSATLDSKDKSVSYSFDAISIPLMGMPELGPCLTVGPEIAVNGRGEFEAHLNNCRKSVELIIDSEGNCETQKDSKDGQFEIDLISGQMDCTLKLSMGLPVKALIISVGTSTSMGYHIKAGIRGNEGGNRSENQAADPGVKTWHMCNPGACVNAGISWESGWGFSATMGLGSIQFTLAGFEIPVIEIGLFRFYYSTTYGDRAFVPDTSLIMSKFDPLYSETICPHKAWRLNLTAVHKNDPAKAVPYASIGLAKAPDYKGRKPTEQSVKANSYFHTGSDGKAVLFIPNGSQTVIRADDPHTPDSGETALTKRAAEESAVVEIDYEPLDLHFFPNTDKAVESMPENRSGYPGDVMPLKGPSGFPRAEGLEFAGWSEDPNTKWNETDKLRTEEQITLDRSYTFYAVWKRYYTIEFHNYDNTLLRSLQVAEFLPVAYSGAKPTRPSDEHYDYVFSGWEPILETTALKDMTYTAQYWAKCRDFYTVTWVDEDGNLLEKDEDSLYLSMPQYNGPTPQKHSTSQQYYFSGWDPEPSPVTGNATYTARFSTVPSEMCIVTFEGDGGYLVPEPQLVLMGNCAAVPLREPLRDGYEFAGWQLMGAPYDFTQPVLNSMTLTAAWDPVFYSFTSGNGQKWLNTSETGASFAISRNLRDEKTYHLFEALYVDGRLLDGMSYTFERGSIRIVILPDYLRGLAAGGHQIKAVFADGEAEGAFMILEGLYTITYNLAGGELPEGEENPSTYTSDDAFTLKNPVLEGHIFAGWTGTGLRSRTSTVFVPRGSAGNRNYTAHWILRKSCAVIFLDTGEGTATGIPAPIIFYPDKSFRLTLPANIPMKTGLRFAGWNTREDGSGITWLPGATLDAEGSMLLYAQWEMNPEPAPAPLPLTGDSSEPVWWIWLILLGTASLAAFSIRRKS